MAPDSGTERVVSVRLAGVADAKALGAFFSRAWKEAGPGALGFTGATDDAIREISSEEFLAQRIRSSKVKILVAVAKKSVVGFASIRAEGPADAELTGIVVLQSESGSGVGTKLLKRSFQLAAKLGFKALTVRTEVFNRRAIGFYKKSGFTESGSTAEKVGRTKVPLVVLRKTIGRTER